jgi:hypothetical protein
LAKQRNFINETHRHEGHSKRPQSDCTSTVVISPHASCPTVSSSSAMKIPKNSEEDPDYPEQAQEGVIQMGYSSD